MANVLFMGGAGNVGAPAARFLMGKGHNVKIGDINTEAALAAIAGNVNGTVASINADRNNPELQEAVREADLVISYLPAFLHDEISSVAIASGVHFITASYPSVELANCGPAAEQYGSIVVPEMGVDPGFDLMTAQQTIDQLHSQGYLVREFTSYCGGLPEPAVAKEHPLAHGSCWAPGSALTAMTADAEYLLDGQVVQIPNATLFDDLSQHRIAVDGSEIDFLGYPNRDSRIYIGPHGLEGEVQTIIRGTLRYPKWMNIARKLLQTGMLSKENLPPVSSSETFRDYMLRYHRTDEVGIRTMFAQHGVYAALRQVGFFDERIVSGVAENNPFAITLALLNDWLLLKADQRDIIVMQHTFKAEQPESGDVKNITSTFVTFGDIGGDTAMARTVAMPTAVLADLILRKKINLQPGLNRPFDPEIYGKVLPLLEREANMRMEEVII